MLNLLDLIADTGSKSTPFHGICLEQSISLIYNALKHVPDMQNNSAHGHASAN